MAGLPILGLVLAMIAGQPANPSEVRTSIKLRLVPAPKAGEPWLAVSDRPAGEILGREEVPPARLVIRGVQIVGGRNVSVKVFANTVAVTGGTGVESPHFVMQGYILPDDKESAAFTTNAGRTLSRLDKDGLLRRDRPLVFAVVPAPAVAGRPFALKDWSIDETVLVVGEK